MIEFKIVRFFWIRLEKSGKVSKPRRMFSPSEGPVLSNGVYYPTE